MHGTVATDVCLPRPLCPVPKFPGGGGGTGAPGGRGGAPGGGGGAGMLDTLGGGGGGGGGGGVGCRRETSPKDKDAIQQNSHREPEAPSG